GRSQRARSRQSCRSSAFWARPRLRSRANGPPLLQRLRELGWIEGRTVAIEYRWAEGRNERAAELAAELVRLKVDVIATSGTATVVAAKEATSVIPIVFASAVFITNIAESDFSVHTVVTRRNHVQ